MKVQYIRFEIRSDKSKLELNNKITEYNKMFCTRYIII